MKKKVEIVVAGFVLASASCGFAMIMGSDGYADRVIIRNDGHGNAMWSIDASSVAGFGDGLADVAPSEFGLMTDKHLLGDVNGDGFVDRIYARDNGSGWDYAADFSTVEGFGDGVVDTAHSFGDTNLIPVAVVDWNGDGLADRIATRPHSSGEYLEWIINLTTSGGFTTGTADVYDSYGGTNVTPLGVFDVNGDGTLNLVCRDEWNNWAAKDAGTGWYGGYAPNEPGKSFLGDMNNDGLMDRLSWSWGQWIADLSTTNGWGDGTPDLITDTLKDDTILLADLVSLGSYPGYAEWIADFGLSGSDTNRTADLEYGGMGDGMDNLLEYALGGNPTNDDAAAIMPTTPSLIESGGTNYMVYVYRRRDDAALRGMAYSINYKFNLVTDPWTSASNSFEIGSSPINSDFESVTNYLPVADSEETFFKLEITEE